MSKVGREMSLAEWVDQLRTDQPHHRAVREYDELRAALEVSKGKRAELAVLVRHAMTDSCVTTDDGPGCFFCDQADECAKDCPAAKALLGEEEK